MIDEEKVVESSEKEKDFGDSYYQSAVNGDVISGFRDLLMRGGYRIRDADGKICITDPSIAFDTPWHHIVHDHFLDCQRWHSIVFDLFSKVLPKEESFVPSQCQQCWKVVVRPRTLISLFSLLEIQVSLSRPSKCGIEVRPYVHGNYGGYFYNHSLEEGLECYKAVREIVSENKNLGPETPVVLKRSCTEYEMKCEPSDSWKITPRQIRIETLINKWYVRDTTLRKQPEHAISHVHRKWIEFAYSIGDGTYLNFTDGKPLYKPLVMYHHLATSDDETRQKELDKFNRAYFYGYDL